MVVEYPQGDQKQCEPRQAITGDSYGTQETVELRQEDVQDERKTVVNCILDDTSWGVDVCGGEEG